MGRGRTVENGIRRWSIQRRGAWKEALRHGVLRADDRFVDPDFVAAYGWMCRQMAARIEFRLFRTAMIHGVMFLRT